MIYTSAQLESFSGVSKDKVDEYLAAMVRYCIDQQAPEETSSNPTHVEQKASREYWDSHKEQFNFTKPVPCFKQVALRKGVDLADDMTCYAIAATKTLYMVLDSFMECVVVDLFSAHDLFDASKLTRHFWDGSLFLCHMSESSHREWEGQFGVPVPDLDVDKLKTTLNVLLKPAFDAYVDDWMDWLRHYADKTDDAKASLNAMVKNFAKNSFLVKPSAQETKETKETKERFCVAPAYDPDDEHVKLCDLLKGVIAN